jgi:hypothetical protein
LPAEKTKISHLFSFWINLMGQLSWLKPHFLPAKTYFLHACKYSCNQDER